MQRSGIPINVIVEDIQQYIPLDAWIPNAVNLIKLKSNKTNIYSLKIPNIIDKEVITNNLVISKYIPSMAYLISDNFSSLNSGLYSFITFVNLPTTAFFIITPPYLI